MITKFLAAAHREHRMPVQDRHVRWFLDLNHLARWSPSY